MKLLTSRLEGKKKSGVRFVIVGTLGTGLQYALYYVFLKVLEWITGAELDSAWVTTAFTVAYVIEVVVNYLATSYYTFSTKPDLKNAGGFAFGRLLNYFVQIGFLRLCLLAMSEELAGIVAIVLAGVVNFFVMHFFFRKK